MLPMWLLQQTMHNKQSTCNPKSSSRSKLHRDDLSLVTVPVHLQAECHPVNLYPVFLNIILIADGSNGGGPPEPSMICLYPEMLRAAAKEKEKAGQAQYEDESGPPDPSMICLYPEMLRAAAKEKEKAEQAQEKGKSGPPDPSMICLYPESLRAAQEGKK